MRAPTIHTDETELPRGTIVVDARANALRELYATRRPQGTKGISTYDIDRERFIKESTIPSVYVYYPWLRKAVRTLPEKEYFQLRTARNRHLITEKEQEAFRAGRVGIAGLSVGSAILNALVMSGGPKRLKIADLDVVEITNLNRLRASLPEVGEAKTDVAARMVWELDPYAQIELFPAGITADTVESFVISPRLDLVIDQMDSIEYKVRLRLIAKRERIPVLMATDNGNGIILDVERFDLEPGRPIFHGLVPFTDPAELKGLDFRDWLLLATKIVGPEYLGERMRTSVLEVGRSIPSVPQLGASASFAGAAVAYAVRLILSRGDLRSGRYAYTLEQLIDPAYDSPGERRARKESAEHFLRELHSRS